MSLLQALGLAAQVAGAPRAAKPVKVAPTSVAELEFQAQRSAVRELIAVMQRLKNDVDTRSGETGLAQADALARAQPPAWVAARAMLVPVRRHLLDVVRAWAVGVPTAQLNALQSGPAAGFLAAEIAQLTRLRDEAAAAVASEAWNKAILAGRQLVREIETVEDVAERRAAYDRQRRATVAAIAALRSHKVLEQRLAVLDQRVLAADALATRTAMHFEDGAQVLAKVLLVCAKLRPYAEGADTFARERADAAALLVAARKKTTLPVRGDQLDAVGATLARADAAFQATAALDEPLPATEAARAILTQARADLAAAQAAADELGPTLTLQASAAGAKGAGAVRTQLAAVRAAARRAAQAAQPAPVEASLAACRSALDDTQAALAARQPDAAAKALRRAADALLQARERQVDLARHAELRNAVAKRRAALRALPVARAIGRRIDAIGAALDDADRLDAAGDVAAALVALHAAETAASLAEAAARARALYDTRVRALNTAKRELYEGEGGPRFDKFCFQAEEQAAAFDFDAARHSLDRADAALEAQRVQTIAVLNPNDPTLVDAVVNLAGRGEDKAVDALVRRLPDNTPVAVVERIAKARFGIEFKVVARDVPTVSAKRVYAMLAKVPQDVLRNPSFKVLRHEDPAPGGDRVGGEYKADSETARTFGRPKVEDQQFGAKQLNRAGRPQLPADVEPSCQPANTDPVDVLDWSTLHEVGHSLDDANNFMGRFGDRDDYGGWVEYGAHVEPIAEAVAAQFGYDSVPAQKRFVLDLIQGGKPLPPLPPAGQDWSAALDNVLRWHKAANTNEIWRDHAASMAMRIGERIYQQAYPDEWVSYKAVARKHGLTGYQFRAPGEWFAELYAGFHSGKLKPTHPAMAWLRRLSI